MKNFLAILFVSSLLWSACTPATSSAEPAQETSAFTATDAVPEELQPLALQETPLPAIVEAPLIDSPSILNIEMLNEADGWGVTEEQIVRTNDGGITWFNVTPPGLNDAGYFVYADFFDAAHAWLQFPDMNSQPNGGTLYRTSDGGLTWESFATPFSEGSLRFIDEQNGWMMANLGAGAGSNAVSIFKTSDGGSTWKRTYTNDPNLEGAADTLPLGGLKNFLVALDENTAWVGGVIYAPGQTYLFRSDDGGVTWFNINLVLPEGTVESELSTQGMVFVSSQNGLLALRITSETPETIVYRTEDGGNTWTQLPVNFSGYGILETPSASEMIFYTADQFYVTKDAGKTIQQVSPAIKFGDSIIDMSFVNAQTGWVITSDTNNKRTLYRTEDGGAAWTALIP